MVANGLVNRTLWKTLLDSFFLCIATIHCNVNRTKPSTMTVVNSTVTTSTMTTTTWTVKWLSKMIWCEQEDKAEDEATVESIE